MFRRGTGRIFQALPVRRIVVGAVVFFALVTLVTFFDISAYLDRAASSKRASRAPTVVRPINSAPAAPGSVETLPDPGPRAAPSAVPPPVPASTRNSGPAQFPRGNSSARTSAGTQGVASVYSEQRQENFGR